MLRELYIEQIKKAYQVTPIVAILGPRQCGKTTLARQFQPVPKENYFDLEDLTDISRLQDPKLALGHLRGLIVIDEIQKVPNLFSTLRVLVDQNKDQQYLILGSASRELIKQSSDSLAGRVSYIELTHFIFSEVNNMERLWLRGGFPLSYLAKDNEMSFLWRTSYVRTFLEQDIPNLGIKVPATQLQRFWMMMSHYHGRILNASEIGRSLNVSHNTIRQYIDILSGSFMLRQLQPWFENLKKRQVKSPKIYFRDSGIFHNLLGIETQTDLQTIPKIGISWEGFALEQIISMMRARPQECYFWATHNQAELDLLIISKGKRLGFEFKYTSIPKITKSMLIAKADLNLDVLTVIFPGKERFKLTQNIEAVGLERWLEEYRIKLS